MLMRDQMISPDTKADFGRSAMVASILQTRVLVINHLELPLIWRSREQRERE